MQETQVWSLDREDPTCHGATEPMGRNYWVCALEPRNRNYWAHHATATEACSPRACAPQQEKLPQWEAGTLQLEKSPGGNKDPAHLKINK